MDNANKKDLEGWKVIAKHIDVSETTARKYYREHNLPVRKLGGRYRAARADLDRWIRSGKPVEMPIGREPLSLLREDKGPSSAKGFSRVIGFATLHIGALVFLSWAWVLEPLPSTATIESVQLQNQSLRAFDLAGREVWQLELPDIDPTAYAASLAPIARDVDGDGTMEVFFNHHPRPSLQQAGRMLCFTQSGEVRWSFSYQHELTVGGRYFSPLFVGHHFRWIEETDKPLLLIITRHIQWYPSRLVLLDPEDGRLVAQYWHPGYVEALALVDLDGNGRKELIVGGINNPNQGTGHPALAVLDLPFKKNPLAANNFFGADNGQERAYILFPKQDHLAAQHHLGAVSEILPLEDQLWVSITSSDVSLVIYELDHSLELISARPSDTTIQNHDALRLKGLLDHSFNSSELISWETLLPLNTAPDGNSPELSIRFSEASLRRANRQTEP